MLAKGERVEWRKTLRERRYQIWKFSQHLLLSMMNYYFIWFGKWITTVCGEKIVLYQLMESWKTEAWFLFTTKSPMELFFWIFTRATQHTTIYLVIEHQKGKLKLEIVEFCSRDYFLHLDWLQCDFECFFYFIINWKVYVSHISLTSCVCRLKFIKSFNVLLCW